MITKQEEVDILIALDKILADKSLSDPSTAVLDYFQSEERLRDVYERHLAFVDGFKACQEIIGARLNILLDAERYAEEYYD